MALKGEFVSDFLYDDVMKCSYKEKKKTSNHKIPLFSMFKLFSINYYARFLSEFHVEHVVA